MKKKQEKELLIDMPIGKALLQLSIPIVLANMLQVAYQFTDSFWVGRLGAGAVATATLSGSIIFMTISIGTGFAVAGSILIAQYFGAKNKKMVNHIAAQSLLMIFFTSIILSLIGYIFTPNILNLIGIEANIYNDTLNFIRISFLGLAFNFCFFMFQAIMRGIGKPNIPIFIVLFTVLLNFVFDPLFIFGYGYFPAFGVLGAAIATLITQALAAFIGFFILFNGKMGIYTRLVDYKPDFVLINRAFKLGFPSSIEMTARSFSFFVMTVIVTMFGTVALASYGIAGNIIQFIVIFSMGLSISTSILVGQSVGAGMIEKAKKINKISAIISFGFLTLFGIITFIFAPYFVDFIIPGNTEVIKIGTQFIRISSLFFGFIGIQMSINGVLRAIGKTQIPMYITIISQWIIKIPLAYFLSKYTYLGLSGIWWSEPITNVLIAIIIVYLVIKVDWSKSNLTKENELKKEVYDESIIEEGIKN